MTLPLRMPFAPMEALAVDGIPAGPQWQYEPKWDGFRTLVFADGKKLELQSKSGRSMTRYFPEVVEALQALAPRKFVLDGEIAVPSGRGFSFDALLQRVHPAASRVRKLAVETPALFIAFDLLVDAKGWLKRVGATLDGVIAKRRDFAYRSGDRSGMQKIKNYRSADCVVGGFRYNANSTLVGSLLLGLYDSNGLLHHVGFTSTIKREDKPALTKKLKALVAPPGFTGNAPGGPSRWSTERSGEWQPLKPKLVVEVCYDHFSGDRCRHGTRLLRWRPDKAPRQCTLDQVKQKKANLLALLS